jgi:hypothetical protein
MAGCERAVRGRRRSKAVRAAIDHTDQRRIEMTPRDRVGGQGSTASPQPSRADHASDPGNTSAGGLNGSFAVDCWPTLAHAYQNSTRNVGVISHYGG